MYTNTCMFCIVYSSIQKFTIITIMKTTIFILIIFVISILSNYLNYRTALVYMSVCVSVILNFVQVRTAHYKLLNKSINSSFNSSLSKHCTMYRTTVLLDRYDLIGYLVLLSDLLKLNTCKKKIVINRVMVMLIFNIEQIFHTS